MKHLEIAVWTPWAQVLCVACHDQSPHRNRGRILEPRVIAAPFEQKGFSRGWCDSCDKAVVAPIEVGQLQQLQRRFGGLLRQMGGGVPGLSFRQDDHIVHVSNVDDFVIGIYSSDDDELVAPLDEIVVKHSTATDRERALGKVLREG